MHVCIVLKWKDLNGVEETESNLQTSKKKSTVTLHAQEYSKYSCVTALCTKEHFVSISRRKLIRMSWHGITGKIEVSTVYVQFPSVEGAFNNMKGNTYCWMVTLICFRFPGLFHPVLFGISLTEFWQLWMRSTKKQQWSNLSWQPGTAIEKTQGNVEEENSAPVIFPGSAAH